MRQQAKYVSTTTRDPQPLQYYESAIKLVTRIFHGHPIFIGILQLILIAESFRKTLLANLSNVLKSSRFVTAYMTFSADILSMFKICHNGCFKVSYKFCNTICKRLQTIFSRTLIIHIVFYTLTSSLPRVSIKNNDWSSGDIWRCSVFFQRFQSRRLANACKRFGYILISVTVS